MIAMRIFSLLLFAEALSQMTVWDYLNIEIQSQIGTSKMTFLFSGFPEGTFF